METINDLLASIRRTNNGYLFSPTPAEMNVAVKHTDIFDIRRGQIHIRGVACEHPRKPEPMDMSRFVDQPDYELAILERQEKYINY